MEGGQIATFKNPSMEVVPTVLENLQREKKSLEKRLTDVNHAIELISKQDGLVDVLDALRKLGHL